MELGFFLGLLCAAELVPFLDRSDRVSAEPKRSDSSCTLEYTAFISTWQAHAKHRLEFCHVYLSLEHMITGSKLCRSALAAVIHLSRTLLPSQHLQAGTESGSFEDRECEREQNTKSPVYESTSAKPQATKPNPLRSLYDFTAPR